MCVCVLGSWEHPRKQCGVFITQAVLAFPSGFVFRVIRPLDFEELDRLLTCAAFSLVKNADRMLFIGEVLLQFEHFMVHCSDWVLEAASEL